MTKDLTKKEIEKEIEYLSQVQENFSQILSDPKVEPETVATIFYVIAGGNIEYILNALKEQDKDKYLRFVKLFKMGLLWAIADDLQEYQNMIGYKLIDKLKSED